MYWYFQVLALTITISIPVFSITCISIVFDSIDTTSNISISIIVILSYISILLIFWINFERFILNPQSHSYSSYCLFFLFLSQPFCLWGASGWGYFLFSSWCLFSILLISWYNFSLSPEQDSENLYRRNIKEFKNY